MGLAPERVMTSTARPIVLLVLVALLVALATPSPALAGCRKLCRQPIIACRQGCDQPERKARRACRATCKRNLMAFCRASAEPACTLPNACDGDSCSSATKWVTAYYTGYGQDMMPPSEIDFASLTHLVHFSAVPRADGSLDTETDGLTAEHSAAVVAAAHAAGRKVLVTVGGADTRAGFAGAMSADRRGAFVTNVVALVIERGYDGLDLDMEPIEPGDYANYAAFTRDVRAALNTAGSGLLLTAAIQPDARDLFLQLVDVFDQINIMTYNLSGPYPGWITWHDAPLYDGSRTFDDGSPVPSADRIVRDFIDAGFPAGRLGIGVIDEVAIWHGATGPGQGIEGVTLEYKSYRDVLATLWTAERERFDEGAGAAYLSVDLDGTANDLFVSYENEATCTRKMDYVRTNRLGGVILWDLGNGYLPDRPAGERNPLLRALADAATAG